MRYIAIIILCLVGLNQPVSASDSKDFLSKHFSQIPKAQRIWLNKEQQKTIKSTINPSQIKLSYRYWQKDNITFWILDEIGKERNITTAIVVKNGKIETVEVITYRESRGGAVKSERFVSQYLAKDKNSNLTKEIDSISGATLSVNALNKQVKLALFLDTLR